MIAAAEKEEDDAQRYLTSLAGNENEENEEEPSSSWSSSQNNYSSKQNRQTDSGRHNIDFLFKRRMSLKRDDDSASGRQASRTVIIRNSSRLASTADLVSRLTPSSAASSSFSNNHNRRREVIEYATEKGGHDISFVSTRKGAVSKSSTFHLLPPAAAAAKKIEKQRSVAESELSNSPAVRRTQTAAYLRQSSPLHLLRRKVETSSTGSTRGGCRENRLDPPLGYTSTSKLTETIKYLEPKVVSGASKLRRSKEINLSLDSHMVVPKQQQQHFAAASTDSERSAKEIIMVADDAGAKIRLSLQERSKTSLERDYQTSHELILGKSSSSSFRKQLTRQLTTSSLKNCTTSSNENESSGDSGIVDYESSKSRLQKNIQSSFLTYGSTAMNPFASNFDIVSKDNPAFYKTISSTNGSTSDLLNRRFNRANANPSIMSLINHFRSVNLASDKIREEEEQHQHQLAKKSAAPTTGGGGKNKEAAVEAVKPADHSETTGAKSRLNAFNTVRMADLSWNVQQSSPEQAMSSNDSMISNNQAAVQHNFFLNYRQLTDLKKDEPAAREETTKDQARTTGPKTKTTTEHKTKLAQHSKSAAPQVTSRSMTVAASRSKHGAAACDHLAEHRLNNGPENFLEAHKIARIQGWIDEVERVQRVEGKWRDVINVITFYD